MPSRQTNQARHRREHERSRAQSGFSLIELMVAGALLAAVMAGASGLLFRSQALFERHNDTTAALAEARNASRWMARAIRLAGYRSEDIDDAVAHATRDELWLTLDLDDGDPAIPCTAEPAPERVTFRVQQGALQMRIQCRGAGSWETGNPWHELLDDLTNTTVFRYFDADGVEMLPGSGGLTPAQLDQVVSISFTIDVQPAETSGLGEGGERARVNLTSRAYLRSRAVVP